MLTPSILPIDPAVIRNVANKPGVLSLHYEFSNKLPTHTKGKGGRCATSAAEKRPVFIFAHRRSWDHDQHMTNDLDKNGIKISANDPILPTVVEVMKLVYQHYDPTKTPEIDSGVPKFSAHVSYEVSKWDPFNPVGAILYLSEDCGDVSKIHFGIDLLYPCIRDRFTRRQHRTPPNIWSLIEELKSYANKTVESRRSSRETGYYCRLRKNDLLSTTELRSYQKREPGSGWAGTCPACFESTNGKGSELIACVECGILGCAKSGCRGHEIHGIKQSTNNPGETYCRQCNGEGENARLISCTKCRSRWFNPRRHPRCVGRPRPLIVVNIPSGIRGRRWPSQRKSFRSPDSQHPPEIAPCGECWEEDNNKWFSCRNPSCWSLSGVVCKACSPNGGMKCAGGHTWFCDECSDQLSSLKCCSNPDRDGEEQVGRDLEAVFGPRGYLGWQESDDLSNAEQLHIFS